MARVSRYSALTYLALFELPHMARELDAEFPVVSVAPHSGPPYRYLCRTENDTSDLTPTRKGGPSHDPAPLPRHRSSDLRHGLRERPHRRPEGRRRPHHHRLPLQA